MYTHPSLSKLVIETLAPYPWSYRAAAVYFFGGSIMMCAAAVPDDMSQGAPSLAFVERPVVWGVAKGTYITQRKY